MESDPLLENLDGLLPLDTGSVTSVPANLPAAIEDLCAALANEPGVESVDIGRQVCIDSSLAHMCACFDWTLTHVFGTGGLKDLLAFTRIS